MEDRTFKFRFDRLPSFSKETPPTISHGSIDVFENKREKVTLDSTLVVKPSRKQFVPKFGNQTLVDTQAISINRGKVIRIFKSAYSPQLKAPVSIEWSIVDLAKNVLALMLDCKLSSISGTRLQSNETVKK